MTLHNLAKIGLTGALLAATAQVATAQDGPRLYLGVGNTSSEYWQQMIWGATTMIESVGGTIEIISNDFDPQKSIQNMSAIVAAGCEDCLFVWFPDSPSIVPVLVERVEEAGGLITTLWNRPEEMHPWDTGPETWISHISFDGIFAGYNNGMALCEAIGGEGQIAVLRGLPDNAPSIQRNMGLDQALAECPGMTIIAEQVADWQQAKAQEVTRTWLVQYGEEIDGIFAANDAMGLGAVAALREVGMAGQVPVTGTDGSSDVIGLIRDGEMLSTVAGLNEYQGAVAVALLIAAQRGDIDPATLEEAQRDFFINQVLVTAENAEAMLAASPDPADYSYDAIMADFWATSAGQIPAGVN